MTPISHPLPESMLAARLHGPSDLRLEEVPLPGLPGKGQVLIKVSATGICGSDLHSYQDARIGDTVIQAPLILGHEFSGVVVAVGPDSLDGHYEPIQPGARVAIDPAQPCERCEFCEHGHPNLCRRLHFCGNYPDGGSLCQYMIMPSRSCFPIPENMDFTQAALLEPLGVAIHAIDLAKIRLASTVAILGAGPIGLLLLQLAKLSGATQVFITDRLPWRLKKAAEYGAIPIQFDREDPVQVIRKGTGGRGVDIVIEAAWADHSVGQSMEMARLGGRVVLVGIPSEDRVEMKASTARRKGLTIMMCRRMKLVYPRAIALTSSKGVDLSGMVSHRFPLKRTVEAFALNTAYQDDVVKLMIQYE